MAVITTLQDVTIVTTLDASGGVSTSIEQPSVTVQQSGGNIVVTTMQGPKGSNGATGPQGLPGPRGDAGAQGVPGADGVGVPSGGTSGQVLSKINSTNYNTHWVDPSSGGSWGSITGTLSAQTDLQTALNGKLSWTDNSSAYGPDAVAIPSNSSGFAALTVGNVTLNAIATMNTGTTAHPTEAGFSYDLASFAGGAFFGGLSANNRTQLARYGTITGFEFDANPYVNTNVIYHAGNLTLSTLSGEPAITAGTTSQYWRGDKSWQTLNKAAVGLGNVDNTSDVNKPVSTAQQTALDGKLPYIDGGGPGTWVTGQYRILPPAGSVVVEGALTSGSGAQFQLDASSSTSEAGIVWGSNTSWSHWWGFGDKSANTRYLIYGDRAFEFDTAPYVATNVIYHAGNLTLSTLGGEAAITAGTTSQYWRGDKSWQTLNKTAVGLANVDNTSDANKPVSTAQQTALDDKLALSKLHNYNYISNKLTFFEMGGVGGGIIGIGADDTTSGWPYFSLASNNGTDWGLFGGQTAHSRIAIDGNKAWEFTSQPYVGTNAIYHAGNKPTKADVGLGNVDNTSDVNKPVSTAQQSALDLKAPLASPTFTGKVTTAASATGGAGANLPHGAAPTSPVNGDIWTTSAGGLFVRINGATYSLSGSNTGDQDLSGLQPLDGDLTAIAALSGTSGLLKKTAANTWTLDTTSYATGGGSATGTNTGDQTITLTGDVTGSGTGSFATTIGSNKVTNGMLAQVATATFKGRTTAATGNVEDLTATQATALLNAVVGDSGSGGTKGLVPAPASGDAAAGKYLKADGTWTAPAGGGGTTTNALTINNGGSGAASGSTFNGSAAVTLSYNSIGAAPLASPTFTGTPAAPTAAVGTNTTQLATTAFTQAAVTSVTVSGVVGGPTILSAAQAGAGVIIITGTLISNSTVSFGSSTTAIFNRTYTVVNNTTGAFTVTLQACALSASGTVVLGQGKAVTVYTNGAVMGVTGMSSDVQVFTTTGAFTWTKPTGAKTVEVVCVGGGGGGQPGTANTTTANAYGGGGGHGGGWSYAVIDATTLGATVTGSVGAGGASNAAGANSYFGSSTIANCLAGGGKAGGGAAGGTAGPGGGAGMNYGGNGGYGTANATGNPSGSSQNGWRGQGFAPSGGGSGGGGGLNNGNAGGGYPEAVAGTRTVQNYNSATITNDGGGGAGGTSGATAGVAGTGFSAGDYRGGQGGGGGYGANASNAGGTGGAGAFPGGGGGGGGGAMSGAAGAGGTGGNGTVIVTTYC